MFVSGASASGPRVAAEPVPIETNMRFRSPVAQPSWYAGAVAMRYSKNAGIVIGGHPAVDEDKRLVGVLGSHCTVSGGK